MKRLVGILLGILLSVCMLSAATTTTFLDAGTDSTFDFSFYASTTGTVTSDSAQVYTGPRSLKIVENGAVATNSGVLADAGSQISFYFYFDTTPTGSATFMSLRDSGNANTIVAIALTSGDQILIAPTGATSVTGSDVLSVNTWYRVSISYFITNSTTYAVKVYLNGTLEGTANAGTLTTTGTSVLRPICSSVFGVTANCWYDNIYVATGGASSGSQPDTGNIVLTAKRPHDNGTSVQFTTQIGSGGSSYGNGHTPQVNERPLSTTNGWSISTAAVKTEEYSIETRSTGDVDLTGKTIVDFVGWIYADNASSSNSPVSHIIVAGTSTAKTLTQSPAMYTQAAGSTTYPAGNTDIGMDGAYTTTAHLWSLFEAGIIIAYNPSALVKAATDVIGTPYAIQENSSRVYSRVVSASDTIPVLSDNSSRIYGAVRAVAESDMNLGLQEVSSRIFGAVRSVSDAPAAPQDKSTRIFGAVRSNADASAIQEYSARMAANSRTTYEAAVMSDSIARILGAIRAVNEQNSPSDVAVRIAGLIRTTSEQSGSQDVVGRTMAASRSGSEQSLISDYAVRILAFSRAVSEQNSPSDAAARIAGFNRAFVDAGLSSDVASRMLAITRSGNDGPLLNESGSRLFGGLRSGIETFTITESGIRMATNSRTFTEAGILADATARTAAMARVGMDQSTGSDNPLRSQGLARLGLDAAFPADMTSRAATLSRLYFETIPTVDNAMRSRGVTRAAIEAVLSFDIGNGVHSGFTLNVLPQFQFVLGSRPTTFALSIRGTNYNMPTRLNDMLMQRRIQDLIMNTRMTTFQVQ